MSRQEVERLWQRDNLPSPIVRNELIIKLLWFTGIRCSELVEIEFDNIDRKERPVSEPMHRRTTISGMSGIPNVLI